MDVTVPDVGQDTLVVCIGDHEVWANLFILHRNAKSKFTLKESPGCWFFIWGWPLLILIGASVGALIGAFEGKPQGLIAPVVIGGLMLLLRWFFNAQASGRATALATLPVLDLLATPDTTACLECEAEMAVDGPGMIRCGHCDASHMVAPPIEEMTKSMLFGRLAEAKRLGHQAADQAMIVHAGQRVWGKTGEPNVDGPIKGAYFQPACLAKIRRLKS